MSDADGFGALAAAEVAIVAREKYAAMPELQNLDRKHLGCENF